MNPKKSEYFSNHPCDIICEKFMQWMIDNDFIKLFHDTGNILSRGWYDQRTNKFLIHIIQPNHLHFLGFFNVEKNTLETLQKNLTKKQLDQYLQDNFDGKYL